MPQFGIEIITHVRRRISHGVCHVQQRYLLRREPLESALMNCGDLVITISKHSAAGRISVDSKWTPDADCGSQHHQRPQALRDMRLLTEQPFWKSESPENPCYSRRNLLWGEISTQHLAYLPEDQSHQERSPLWINAFNSRHGLSLLAEPYLVRMWRFVERFVLRKSVDAAEIVGKLTRERDLSCHERHTRMSSACAPRACHLRPTSLRYGSA